MAGEKALYFGVIVLAPGWFRPHPAAVEDDRVVGDAAIVIVMNDDAVRGQRFNPEFLAKKARVW